MTLTEEINQLYISIKEPFDRTPQGLMNELDYRCQWLARAAELEADCQELLDKKRGEIAQEFANSKQNWNVTKILIESRSLNEKKLYSLAERLNATLTHQIDAVRSLLSFEKESMRNG